jgi:hypothetical protein
MIDIKPAQYFYTEVIANSFALCRWGKIEGNTLTMIVEEENVPTNEWNVVLRTSEIGDMSEVAEYLDPIFMSNEEDFQMGLSKLERFNSAPKAKAKKKRIS